MAFVVANLVPIHYDYSKRVQLKSAITYFIQLFVVILAQLSIQVLTQVILLQ